MARRSTFSDRSVSYAAVGASGDPNLLAYPPKGFRAHEERIRLGSGRARFATAGTAVLTWGAQLGAGVRVSELEPGVGEGYAGLSVDATGRATARVEPSEEDVYGPEGRPFITPGMTALLEEKLGPFTAHRRVRVIYAVEEADRIGFAFGTLDRTWTVGEQQFLVTRDEDDAVWAQTRGFHAVLRPALRPIAPLLVRWQRRNALAQLRALLPALGGGRAPAEPDGPADTAPPSGEPGSADPAGS